MCGAWLAGGSRILDFWSLGAPGRDLLDLSLFFFVLLLVCSVMGLFINSGIALWHRHYRRSASDIFAIAAIPLCFAIIVRAPLFDPWFWYAFANSSRFEALTTNDPPPDGPKYALIEVRDVSTGLAGLNPNHFVAFIYDESDAAGLEPSERPSFWRTRTEFGNPLPKGTRLYGHIFRVDIFV